MNELKPCEFCNGWGDAEFCMSAEGCMRDLSRLFPHSTRGNAMEPRTMKASEIGLPPYEVHVDRGTYCAGCPAKMVPVEDAKYIDADKCWVRGDLVAEKLGRLAEVEAKLLKYENSPEQKARDQMILDVIRAKRDAGFNREVAFFKDVWPLALAALKTLRAAEHKSETHHDHD